jgi:hypothetical protein
MNIKAVIGIVISALSLALTFSSIHAQTAGEILKAYESLKKPERKTRLVERAKKEGRLVVYGTLGVDAARPMLEKFRQAHPYIAIGHYRSGSTGVYNRVVNEEEPENTKETEAAVGPRQLADLAYKLA